jgi:predicted transcriptional regulator
MRSFGQLLLVDKQNVASLYKTTSKGFEFLHKSYATAVAMTAITFQDGGYFGFKEI